MAQKTKESKVTTDHETIRKWVQEREGKPAHVKSTGNKNDAGLLRIDFPGSTDKDLEEIDWDEFFEKFDKNNLAFLYQEKTKDGGTSRFNKFVDRDSV